MATTRPRLRLAVLCSYVDTDADGLPFALTNLIHTIRVPFEGPDAGKPRILALYAQIQNAAGGYEFAVEVRNEHGEVIHAGEPWRVTFPGTEHRVIPSEQVFELGVVFPEPGVYSFRILCDGRSLHDPESADDQPFPPSQVNVLN